MDVAVTKSQERKSSRGGGSPWSRRPGKSIHIHVRGCRAVLRYGAVLQCGAVPQNDNAKKLNYNANLTANAMNVTPKHFWRTDNRLDD